MVWRVVPVAAAAAVFAAGCAGEAAPGSDWRRTDVCALLPADEVAAYLGRRPPPDRNDTAIGPGCVWRLDDVNKIELTLWLPPVPDVLTDNPERTMDVGGRTAYVTSQTATACLMDVDAGDRWLHLDVSSPTAPGGDLTRDGATCDRVATTAATLLRTLGW